MTFFANSSGIIWRQLHGLVLFPFQALFKLLTVLNTAGGTQVLGRRKDRAIDSCDSDDYAQADDLRGRCWFVNRRSLAQLSYFTHAFVIDRKGK